METYEKLCTDFRALSYEYPMTRATSAHAGEKWLPLVSAIEHAPFHRRNRVAGIMSEIMLCYEIMFS